jgi:hypothetical protein
METHFLLRNYRIGRKQLMLNKIEKIFTNREAKLLGDLKKSAVMILLCEEEGKTLTYGQLFSIKLNKWIKMLYCNYCK